MDTHPRGKPSTDMSAHAAVSGGLTVNADGAEEVELVTTIVVCPAAALAGTLVEMEVALPAVIAAATPPMVTVAPLNPVPVMVTGVPAEPEAGVTAMILGAGSARTVKAAVAGGNAPTVTTTPPTEAAVAVPGTLVVIVVPLLLVTVVLKPPIRTVAPVREVPAMVTMVPAVPLDGDTDVMIGAAC